MTTYVDPYPGRKGSERVWFACGRCDGTGSVPWGVPADRLVPAEAGGEVLVPYVCFGCGGTGRDSHLVSSARSSARRRAKAAADALTAAETLAAREEERERAEAARLAEFEANNPGLAAGLVLVGEDFAESLKSKIKAGIELTENQKAALLRAVADVATAEVVEGRGRIEGRITSARWVDSDYGSAYKVTVLDDRGFKVWGTCPRAIVADAEVGVRVAFTATVEASERDAKFGFYKRPTGAELIG